MLAGAAPSIAFGEQWVEHSKCFRFVPHSDHAPPAHWDATAPFLPHLIPQYAAASLFEFVSVIRRCLAPLLLLFMAHLVGF